ncbi:hypothetical protein LGK95_02285 [Clostridium algoriphilum]|uniref:hypothetical protein n=1 Tax=Clostridium algoriphilum TaxID=198347 RepID=UPI001CF30CF2|nr:hypothetical protein [Clostridium algoriphilum]MCB2292367.1 hypothetical protein [Clostridium algoriphilum]
MGKIIDLKKEYEVYIEDIKEMKGSIDTEKNNEIKETQKDSLSVIHQFVEAFYRDEGQEKGEIHPYEINGFEVGLISYLNLLEKGLLPYSIKNINVLAVKKFERLTNLFPEVPIPQEFYIGFLKGFCSLYKKYM